MRARAGFTILEVIVYFALVLLMTTVLGRVTLQVSRYISSSRDILTSMRQKHLLFDLLRRDMMCASCRLCDWDCDAFVFKKGEVAVGFCVNEHGVWRRQGEYDFVTRFWRRKVTSRVCSKGRVMRWKLNCANGLVRGGAGDLWRRLMVCASEKW